VREAILFFKNSVDAHPDSWISYDSLAEAYMINGEEDRAILHYQRSLELNPDNVNAVEMLKRLQQN
jgi:cytochrome c-type biogenesis protein CcmH/NrfG